MDMKDEMMSDTIDDVIGGEEEEEEGWVWLIYILGVAYIYWVWPIYILGVAYIYTGCVLLITFAPYHSVFFPHYLFSSPFLSPF